MLMEYVILKSFWQVETHCNGFYSNQGLENFVAKCFDATNIFEMWGKFG